MVELQQKYMEYQMIEQQKQKVVEHLQKFDEQIGEVEQIITHINEMTLLKGNEETMLPLANGIFARGTISNVAKLYVNVGAGITVDKTPEQTIELLERQKEEILQYKNQLLETLQQLMIKSDEIENDMKRLMEEQEKHKKANHKKE